MNEIPEYISVHYYDGILMIRLSLHQLMCAPTVSIYSVSVVSISVIFTRRPHRHYIKHAEPDPIAAEPARRPDGRPDVPAGHVPDSRPNHSVLLETVLQ